MRKKQSNPYQPAFCVSLAGRCQYVFWVDFEVHAWGDISDGMARRDVVGAGSKVEVGGDIAVEVGSKVVGVGHELDVEKVREPGPNGNLKKRGKHIHETTSNKTIFNQMST